MNDKSALLGNLKIDRSAAPPPRKLTWLWVGLALLLVSALAAAYFLNAEPPPEIGVATAVAASSDSAGSGSVLDASGYVVARRQATVSAKVTGKVTEVLIEEGMRVEPGQVMARLDATNVQAQLALAQSQLAAARAGLAEGQAQLDEAQRQLKRTREIAAQKLVSQAALDTAQANFDTAAARLESQRKQVDVAQRSVDVAQQQVDDHVVRAPFGGVVTFKAAQVGEIISPLSAGGGYTRTGIGTIVDMDSLEIEVDVNENYINRVRAGQPVQATLNAYPDWKIPAQVEAVIPAADRSKATVRVRVRLLEKDPRILPDMGVRVSFLAEAPATAEAAPRGVYVPETALAQDGDKTVVFLVRDEHVERRAVAVGTRRNGQALVTAGLAAGERVATGELSALADGDAVRVRQ